MEARLLPLIAWWVIIQMFGLAALPLARRIFAWLPDRGYAFSKTAGLLLVSYLLWLGASAGSADQHHRRDSARAAARRRVSAWIAFARGWQDPGARMRSFWQQNKGHILVAETAVPAGLRRVGAGARIRPG